MKSKVSTLLLYCTNIPNPKRILTDTIRLRLGIHVDRWPAFLRNRTFIAKFFREGYQRLSYVMDWYEAFLESPRLQMDACNINDVFRLGPALKKMAEYELIVILHSAAGDHMRTLQWAESVFQKRKGKLVVCFGNEYILMPEKIGFAQAVRADFIVSQLPEAAAQWLYSDCQSAKVIVAPAALNPKMYRADPRCTRQWDLGFRGSLYSYSIGDIERTRLLLRLQEQMASLTLSGNIRFDLVDRAQWALFLNQSRGIPGAESGTYFLEKNDNVQKSAVTYVLAHPYATFDEIFDACFKGYSHPRSGKAISSRHFEPIGTRTCQLLLEGYYNGILQAEKHYISVKRDLSDLDESLRRFQDSAYRERIASDAYEFVMAHHTYTHRVDHILRSVGIS